MIGYFETAPGAPEREAVDPEPNGSVGASHAVAPQRRPALPPQRPGRGSELNPDAARAPEDRDTDGAGAPSAWAPAPLLGLMKAKPNFYRGVDGDETLDPGSLLVPPQ